MKKRIIVLALVMLFGFFVASCEKTPEPTALTSIVISGASDATLAFEADFNILTGVTALGNDGVDYTADITYVTTSAVLDGDMLDTTKTGAHAIRYEVAVDQIVAQHWRYITVNPPQAVEGEMLVNPDFSNGTAGWDDPSVVYNGDGSSMTLTVEDGALKAEVVAGSNPYTPRFGQMNVPFEQGKAYKVIFDAKSSVEKIINLQVGELLSASPWFTDFKPSQTEHRTITTEWATYDYSFMMTLDNQRGGVLFELGAIGGVGVDATVWFDNIIIEETTLGADVTAPTISGVRANVSVPINDPFNPLTGVTANDNIDGDITDMITVEFFLVVDEVETVATAVDTSAEGVYHLVYTVADAAGNEFTVESNVTIVILDPDLYALPQWRVFLNTWEGTAGNIQGLNGQLLLTLTNINAYAGWHVQIIQDAFALGTGADNVGSLQFVADKTYQVTFDAKSTTAGDIKVAIGSGVPGWAPYHEETVAVTNDMGTYTLTFTTDDTAVDYTVPAQFKLEMGMLFAGTTAEQVFVLDNVKIEILNVDVYEDAGLLENGTMDAPVPYTLGEWRAFLNDWEGTAGMITGVNGELLLTLTNINAYAGWHVQIIQDAFALGTGADNVGSLQFEADKTYQVTFDAKSTTDGDVKVAIGSGVPGWAPYHEEIVAVTGDMTTFTFTFTTDDTAVDYTVPAQFKLEMGMLFAGQTLEQKFTLDNVKIEVLVADVYEDAGLIVNGTMDAPVPYTLGEWRAFLNDWEGTAGMIQGLSGELLLTLTGINAYAGWHVQIIQDAFAMGTGADNVGSLQFVADKTYQVTFDAKSSVAGDIKVAIGSGVPGWAPYHEETVTVTNDMTTYTFTFTTDDAAVDYTVLAQFKLEMGMLFAGADADQTFTLDNVKIEVLNGDVYEDAGLIVNGTMENLEKNWD